MFWFAVTVVSVAVDVKDSTKAPEGTKDSTVSRMDRNALWNALQDYADSEGYVTKAALKKAYSAKDKYGQPLAIPPRQYLLDELDKDHDGRFSKKEVQTWPGYQGRVFCRTLGDAAYGCAARCSAGMETLDGRPGAYSKLEQDLVVEGGANKTALSDSMVARRPYRGEWTKAQTVAVDGVLKKVLAAEVPGEIVQMGLKDPQSWKVLRQALVDTDADNVARTIHLYDNFKGLQECNHEKDTAMCPPAGSNKAEKGNIENDIAKLKNHKYVPRVKEHEFGFIPGHRLPTTIAFASLDPALHEQTWAMLHKVEPRLSVGGRIVIHNYGWEGYTGIEKAVQEYMATDGKDHLRLRLPSSSDGVACYLAELVRVKG